MDKQEHNMGFAFLSRAARNVDQKAIFNDLTTISYGALSSVTINMARHMQAHGAGRGTTVGVSTQDPVVLFSSIFATALLGSRWVFGAKSKYLREVAEIDLLLDTQNDGHKRLPGSVHIGRSWALPPDARVPSHAFEGYADPDDIWMLSPTSGTTGTPKLVGLSHRTFARRVALNSELFPSEGTTICGLFKSSAGGQISRCLSALAHGGTILSDREPRSWSRHQAALVFGSPNQVQQAMAGTVLSTLLPRIHLSGSTAPEKLVRHLLRSFQTVTNGYGSTEGFNILSVSHRLGPDGNIERKTTLRAGAELELVDDQDNCVPVGTEGIVRIRNRVLASGYVKMPELTAQIFRNGWFYPGDLARWSSAGNFEITGRINDQFNLGGVKVNAALMDYQIQNVEGVRDAICFMAPTEDEGPRLTAFLDIEPNYLEHDVMEKIWYALLPLGGPAAVPKRFLRSNIIPRTETGKADRDACVALWREVRRARIAEMRVEKNTDA